MKRLLSVLICVVFAMALLASCSASDGSYDSGGTGSSSTATGSGTSGGGGTGSAPAGGTGQAAPPGSGAAQGDGASDGGAGPLPILTPSQSGGRKLSYTVTMYLQTTSFMPGMRTLLNAVNDTGGFLEDSNIRGRDMREPETERSAEFSFRVPSEQLTDLIVLVENNYNLLSLRQTTTDSTQNYQRADTRLDDLREQESRLLGDLRTPGLTAEDRLALEQQLTQVQTTISELSAQQATIDYNLNYSVVIVHLYEVIFPEVEEVAEEEEPEEESPPTFGERFNETVLRSVAMFVSFCQWMAIAIVAVAPVLLILVILGAIALLIIYCVKKFRLKRMPAEPSSPVAEQGKES